ncbi:hypothetical protein LY10_00009 [Planktotalea frisia]|uniref:Metal-binding protein n=1 Tax=Planktotalea frisia TaxID=696762 RepID=A0A1L9NZM0_9RHOB|nr:MULTISPECIES: DUF411 domain-containing protein [Rhodobacterales]OJI94696.1 hypothetical protein PFRI_12450 [Planktotalea frisia]PZX35626.1 hypothetical protein LY10_00009 [Planktotalea frisia]UOA29899.1 hypothetical protein DSM107133_04662 [Pseudosulfitobacter sp. DSM 107133]
MRQLSLAIAFFLGLATQALAETTPIEVNKTNGCGCCLAWMEHLEEYGFAPTDEDMFAGLLVRFKLDNGVPQRMVSCHTGLIDGYVIEGHVPADDIRRLLSERPDAVGLAVPGMPLGSPGMDQSRWREAYDVFLINNDGTTEVFASYPGD